MVKRRSSDSELAAGVAFASPWIAGFGLLIAGPFVAALLLSFCRWDMIRPPVWVGWDNYQRLLTELQTNTGFAVALKNTAYYSLLSVPGSIVCGIGLAVIAHWPIRGQSIIRTVFFLPAMIPILATCILWMWLFDPQDGWVNHGLSWLGLGSHNWLHQPRTALSGETWSAIHQSVGSGHLPSVFGSQGRSADHQPVDRGQFHGDLPGRAGRYSAFAVRSGRNGRGRALASILACDDPAVDSGDLFQSGGGLDSQRANVRVDLCIERGDRAPEQSLLMISLHLFLAAFVDLEMGYASAMSWIIFSGLIVCTWLLFRTSRHWVYYRFAS